MSQFRIFHGTLFGQELKALARGYFWIDYLSIPQARQERWDVEKHMNNYWNMRRG